MDSDQKLQEIREFCEQARSGNDVRRCEREIRWRFEELDEWLSVGGFLPEAWNQKQKCSTVGCSNNATHVLRWWDREQQEYIVEPVCVPCGDSYTNRPALRAKLISK